jgi:hypothetical protein
MTGKEHEIKTRLAFAAVAAIAMAASATAGASPQTTRLYEMVEVSMINDASFDNPFVDTELRLDVTAPKDRKLGSRFRWYGFHDGDGKGGQKGNVWKFRLLMDCRGTWKVTAGFYKPGTNTTNGARKTFTYKVSDKRIHPHEHGHVRIDPRNPMRFAFDDGTPWVPFSIHSSLLLDREDPKVSHQWIDKHAELGVNTLAARFSSNADAMQERNQYHWLKSDGSRAASWPGYDGFDYSRFDVASYHHNEKILDHAQARGIKLFIWFGITGLNGQYDTPGPLDHTADGELGPLQRLHIRYQLARWAPYTSWWHWTVASEWEETRNRKGGKQIHVNHAKMLVAENPWRMLISNHSLGDWSLNGKKDGWGLATLQKRIGDNDASTIDGAKGIIEHNDGHGIPVFNCEGVWQLANTTRNRIATLSHLMAGGFSNVAVWKKGHIDGSFGCNWPSVIDKHKSSAAALGMLARFFNREDIDINAAKPAHGLVRVKGDGPAMCLAKPGEQYYLWISKGGEVSLDLSGAKGKYSAVLYRGDDLPATGGGSKLGIFSGGEKANLGPTPKKGYGNDYVIVLKRVKSKP